MRYKITAESITPLHIGTGNFLSPFSNLLKEEKINDESRIVIKNTDYVTNEDPEFIKEFINSNERIFVPGSTIKGAVKTAYLYDFLTDFYGKKLLIEWLKEIDNILPKKNTTVDYNRKKKINREMSKSYNKGFEKKIFGYSGSFKLWNNLKFTDSNIIPDGSTDIYELRRFFLNTGHDGIPTFVEAIHPKKEFIFKLNYEKYNPKYSGFKQIGLRLDQIFTSIENIKKLINNFSKKLI
ncbi:MAG: type III-A CRISPR-associated RAMP protein Csm5, partial [Chlorobi bacterium]|nr:type III-A CRISPR-associated RAMP protein Csm5 [Chlorobiota bacterium]